MKRTLKYISVVALICSAPLNLWPQGTLVSNGVYVGNSGLAAFELDVIQNPANGDFTGFFLDPIGNTPPTTTFSYSYYLDEGVRVFLVSYNQPICLEPIMANAYPELTYPNNYVFANNSPFYVGLYTGPRWTSLPPTDPITYDDPLFGWARLVNNQGVIQLLDSALAYQAHGIYVGTQNFVPEPGVFVLAALGGVLFGFRRWKSWISRK